MDKIKKILKIGKIYRIEHETELKNRNDKKRNKNSENRQTSNFDGLLKTWFFSENSGLIFLRKNTCFDRTEMFYFQNWVVIE